MGHHESNQPDAGTTGSVVPPTIPRQQKGGVASEAWETKAHPPTVTTPTTTFLIEWSLTLQQVSAARITR
ncbi:MAG: hypothetical protein WA802_07070, partial [Terracidiphilus sp.]